MKFVAAVLAAVGLGGCAGLAASNPLSPIPTRLSVSSPAFAGGGAIPATFTCQGQDVSPPLRWSGVPPATRTLEIVMRDPDAPGGNFIHWRLTGIPASTRSLRAGQVPSGAKPGRNDFGTLGYRGPCPPTGRAHHYVITVTALDGVAPVGSGTLVGTYARR
jgi:Raf kinase inhibitor-like YbhB/YbcL family protein